MPKKATLQRARRDARQGKSALTQAGQFVREEIHHIRAGDHGARSAKQAIAIGLSQARRAGVKLPPPAKGKTSAATRRKAAQDVRKGQMHHDAPSRKRSQATVRTLKQESGRAASHRSLSRQARQAAQKRSAAARSRTTRKGARTRQHRR